MNACCNPENMNRWTHREFDPCTQAQFVTEMMRCKHCHETWEGECGFDLGNGIIHQDI